MKVIFMGLLIALLLTAQAQDGGFVQEGIHEHGGALLNIALDNEELVLEFISPAINIVGFEYAPNSDEEKQVVDIAIAQLQDPTGLFVLSERAQCSLLSVEVESELAEPDSEHEEHSEDRSQDHGEEGENHEEAEQYEDETHGEEDEHAEDEVHEADEHSEDEIHSEFHAVYTYTCAQASRLTKLDVGSLLALYSGIEDLDAQFVTPSTQGAAELNQANTVVKF